jgi:peptidoglycan/xylan/chitin deacetylase (PgdA/CDA1 family)
MLPGEVDVRAFEWQMKLLAEYFNVLPLGEALELSRSKRLPPRAVCITFDDGYADNVTRALPILSQWKLNATFFIASGFLNGGRMWNDTILEAVRRWPENRLDLNGIGLGHFILDNLQGRAEVGQALLRRLKHLEPAKRQEYTDYIAQGIDGLPNDLMMTSAQVRQLAKAGMEIGGHTVTHPILASLSESEARAEIANGKAQLEEIIKSKIRFFAYPNGKPEIDFHSEHTGIVADCGFEAALSTQKGVVGARSDIWQLPRFTPWDNTPQKFMGRLIHNYLGIS